MQLDILFKTLHYERKEKKRERTHKFDVGALIVLVLALFIAIEYMKFLLKKNLKTMSTSTNIQRPYIYSPLGSYISLVNSSTNPIMRSGKPY